MKKIRIIIFMLLAMSFLYGCSQGKTVSHGVNEDMSVRVTAPVVSQTADENQACLKIEIEDKVLLADFEENSSAQAFKEKLKEGSITVEMSDYGNFEKVGDLPFALPKNDKRITTESGDVILYQGNKITVYYGENTWEFTKLAKIRNTGQSLKEILGEGDVSMTFSLQY